SARRDGAGRQGGAVRRGRAAIPGGIADDATPYRNGWIFCIHSVPQLSLLSALVRHDFKDDRRSAARSFPSARPGTRDQRVLPIFAGSAIPAAPETAGRSLEEYRQVGEFRERRLATVAAPAD